MANPAMVGIQNANSMLKHFATVQAGKSLAAGDTPGAVRTLNNYGDLEGAYGVQQRANAQEDRDTKIDDAKAKQSWEFISDVTSGLMKLKETRATDPDKGAGAVVSAYDQLTPLLQSRGLDPNLVAQYRQSLAQDPDAFLTSVYNMASENLKRYVISPNQILTDPTGKTLATGAPAPKKPITVRNRDGSTTVIEYDPNTDEATEAAPVAPDGQGATAATTIAATPAAPAGDPTGGLLDVLAMGGEVTSAGLRTPESNAAVSGVPNSDHLIKDPVTGGGMARDFFKPPPGKTFEQFAADIRKAMPNAQVIVEPARNGNAAHVHVEFGPGAKKGNTPPKANVVFEGDKTPANKFGGVEGKFAPGTVTQKDSTGKVVVLQQPTAAQRDAAAGTGGAAPKPTKLTPQEEITLKDQRTRWEQNGNMMALLDEYSALNTNQETGGTLAMPGIAQIQATAGRNSALSRMLSIEAQLTPAMRNGLPGAASDKDVAMFKEATVSHKRPRAANEAIRRAVKAKYNREGDFLAFQDAYAKANGTLKGATEVWKSYVDANPLFSNQGGVIQVNKVTPWRSVIKLGDQPKASGVRVYTPGKGFQ